MHLKLATCRIKTIFTKKKKNKLKAIAFKIIGIQERYTDLQYKF